MSIAPYPWQFEANKPLEQRATKTDLNITIPHVRGKIPSLQASKVRSLHKESHADPNKIIAYPCTYDALTSRLVEEAGFPIAFLAGYPLASTHGLPDTGYIAFQEVAAKIQEIVRMINIPLIADGDTGYGSPMNVRRTVEGFALAGAAGVMIEDQSWPKRCGHTKGKSVVSRGEAYARWQAAVDARNEGHDIWILARTDSYYLGYDEAMTRARKAIEIGVDAIFIEALPDKETMARVNKELNFPTLANIIEGGKTQNLSAKELASIGFASVGYPWTLVANHLKSTRQALENLKTSLMDGPPPEILSYADVMHGVGFSKYYELEARYAYEGMSNGANGHQFENGAH